MDWTQVIQTLGFPIACVVACGFFIYKLVTRDKDEAKEREDKLIEANTKFSISLENVANTITESNKINQEQSETIKMLVDKVDTKLVSIDSKLDKLTQ